MKKTIETGTFSLTEAAIFMGVSNPTLMQLTQEIDFPAIKIGRRWVIPKKSLEEWMDKKAKEHAVFNLE